jgi:hypothetical protein
MERLGKPDLFITISANDMDETLIDFLKGKPPQESPVECGMFFMEKAQHLLSFLKKIFGIKDYWKRVEFQHRGSPHIHLLAWTEEVVTMENVNSFVHATIPQGTDPFSVHLREQVKLKQIHTCQQRCFKNSSSACKYGFPFAPCDETHLSADKRIVFYRRAQGEEYVVPYHPLLLLGANAHVNIQMMTTSGARFYVAKYAAKAEPTQPIETKIGEIKRHFTLRLMSVNEAALNILGVHMVQSTRTKKGGG